MKPMHIASVGKTFNQLAGKFVTGSTRGKKYNQWQARENMSPVESAGKLVTCEMRGKTCGKRREKSVTVT